MIGSGI